MKDLSKCICKGGFYPSDGSSYDVDSENDCQKLVYPRCASYQMLDSSGECRNRTDCFDACGESGGILIEGLGICNCEGSLLSREVCNATCRDTKPVVTYNGIGEIIHTETNPETGAKNITTYLREAHEQLYGTAKCRMEDVSDCVVLTLRKDSATGDFLADFDPPKFHNHDLEKADERRRRLNETESHPALKNPVVCI